MLGSRENLVLASVGEHACPRNFLGVGRLRWVPH